MRRLHGRSKDAKLTYVYIKRNNTKYSRHSQSEMYLWFLLFFGLLCCNQILKSFNNAKSHDLIKFWESVKWLGILNLFSFKKLSFCILLSSCYFFSKLYYFLNHWNYVFGTLAIVRHNVANAVGVGDGGKMQSKAWKNMANVIYLLISIQFRFMDFWYRNLSKRNLWMKVKIVCHEASSLQGFLFCNLLQKYYLSACV